jgi:hypothetical protein
MFYRKFGFFPQIGARQSTEEFEKQVLEALQTGVVPDNLKPRDPADRGVLID